MNTPLVLAAPDRLAAYKTPATDLARLREPVLATVPYGVCASTRGRDVFVLLGNAGRVALRRTHAVMAVLQSNRLVLSERHVGMLAEVWADAARLLRLYVEVADRVWGRWVAAADKRAAATAAAAGAPVSPLVGALARLAGALDGAKDAWAALAASRRPDRRLTALFAALHAASGAAVGAFGRAEAVLPAVFCGGGGVGRVAPRAAAAAAARRADAAAMVMAADAYGSAAAAVAAITAWMPSAAWADHFAQTHLRGGWRVAGTVRVAAAAADRATAAGARRVRARRAAEVGGWAAAMVARPATLGAGGVAGEGAARVVSVVSPPPVVVYGVPLRVA